MSQPRFLADHDLNEYLMRGVIRREPAIEFIRARDFSMHERSDAEVLAYAAEHQLIVVSHDVNTMPANSYTRIRVGSTSGRSLDGQAKRSCGDSYRRSDSDLVCK